MFRRVILIWAVANFGVVGVVSLIAGEWYLGWQISPAVKMAAEIGLIILPNLVLPVLGLHYWMKPGKSIKQELGWQWRGKRSLLAGVTAFVLVFIAIRLTGNVLGESIPYQLSGRAAQNGGISATTPTGILLLIAGLCTFVILTAVGEETMFRGLIQTQFGKQYGELFGLLSAALLFGLRHLPNDIFYARIWQASPQMWLSRQIQLYISALVFGLARHFSKSTYASVIAHGLYLFVILFGLG